MNEYFDKNGTKIEVGMELRHNDGDLDIVVACNDEDGDDLGFNATNFNSPGNRTLGSAYSLGQFDLSEWEITDISVRYSMHDVLSRQMNDGAKA